MFDMLLESSHRPSLLPSWGKGVAVTLHVLILGALWRAPASPASVHRVKYIEFFPPEPVTASPHRDALLPPLPGPVCLCVWNLPPVDPLPITTGVLGTPITEIRVATAPGGTGLFGSPDDVYPEALVQEAPDLLSAPTPTYPPLLRAAGVQGQVIVTAVVDTLGLAENGSVRIVRSDNPGFDAPALATVRAARFRPARMYGRAVRVLVQVPVVFRLN